MSVKMFSSEIRHTGALVSLAKALKYSEGN